MSYKAAREAINHGVEVGLEYAVPLTYTEADDILTALAIAEAVEKDLAEGCLMVPSEGSIEQIIALRIQTVADMTGSHMGPHAENNYRAAIAAAPQSNLAKLKQEG